MHATKWENLDNTARRMRTRRTTLCAIIVEWIFLLALSSLSTVSCKTVAISSGFEKQTLRAGDVIKLQCRAKGLYHVTITWLLDGLPLEYTSTKPSVSVRLTAGNPHSRLGFLSGKKPRYSIDNSNERLKDETLVRAGDKMMQIGNLTKSISSGEGKNATAQATNLAYLSPKLVDEPAPLVPPDIDLSEGGMVSVTSVLTLDNATVSDGGIYACVARDVIMDSAEWRRKVAVTGPLSLRQNRPVFALVGSVVVIPCSVLGTGDSLPIKWFHQKFYGSKRSPLPNDRRQTVHVNGSLEIREARKANEGIYTCRADLKGTLANMSTPLRVMVPPKIKPFKLPEVEVGEPVAEFCVVLEGDTPLDISWYKNGVLLRPTKFLEMHRSGKRALSFTISNVNPSSAGNYSCCAENNVSRTCRKSELLVLDPPDIVDLPLEVSAVAANDVFVPCRTTGFPQPNVTWMKVVDDSRQLYSAIPKEEEGTKRQATKPPRLVQTAGGALLITNASSDHGGKYLCRAVNKVDELSRYVTLRVHNAARIVELSGTQDVIYRNDVTIECTSWGDGSVDVTWQKDEKPLPLIGRHIGASILEYSFIEGRHPVTLNRLLIENAARSDTGSYSCQAINKYGLSSKTIDVVVRAPPSKPRSFEVIDKDTSFLRMIIEPGDDDGGSKLLEYELNFTKAGEGPTALPPDGRVLQSPSGERQSAIRTVLYPVSATSPDQEIVLDRLECGTEYRMSIRGVNAIGRGFEALELAARTIGTDPVIPKENELVVDVNQTAVVLDLRAWQNGGCPITDLTIEFARHGDTEWNVTAVDTAALRTELSRLENGEKRADNPGHLVISSLQPGTWYKIWSSACNNAGCNYVTHSVPTLLPSGATLPPLILEAEQKVTESADARFFVPMLCGFGLVLTLALVLLFYRYKQRSKKQTRIKEAKKMRNKLLRETEDCSSAPSAVTEAGRQQQVERDLSDSVNAALVETSTSSAGDDDATFQMTDGIQAKIGRYDTSNTAADRYFDDVSRERFDELSELPAGQDSVFRSKAVVVKSGSSIVSDGGNSRRSEGMVSLKDNAELAVFRDAASSDDESQVAAEPVACDEGAFGDSGTWSYFQPGSGARRPRPRPVAAKQPAAPKRLSSSSSGTDEELAQAFGLPRSKQSFKPVGKEERFVAKPDLLGKSCDGGPFERHHPRRGIVVGTERDGTSSRGQQRRPCSAGTVQSACKGGQMNPARGGPACRNKDPNKLPKQREPRSATPDPNSLPEQPQRSGTNFHRLNGHQPKAHTYSRHHERQQRHRNSDSSPYSGAARLANPSPYGERQWVDTYGSGRGTARGKPVSWAATELDSTGRGGGASPSVKGDRKLDADSPRDSGIGSDEAPAVGRFASSVTPPFLKSGNVRKSPECLEGDGGSGGDKDSVFPPSPPPSPFTSKSKRLPQSTAFVDMSSKCNTSTRASHSLYPPRGQAPTSVRCHSGPPKNSDRFAPTPPPSDGPTRRGWREAELDGVTKYHRSNGRRVTTTGDGWTIPKSMTSSDRQTAYRASGGDKTWQTSTLV